VVGVAGGVSEGHPSEGTLRNHCNDDVRRPIFVPTEPPVRRTERVSGSTFGRSGGRTHRTRPGGSHPR
jgi:hypothetical protein